MNSLLGDIIGLLFSILLIIGGLSGEWVLRGTDSSQLLVIAGVVFLIFDVYRLVTLLLQSKLKVKNEEQHFVFLK